MELKPLRNEADYRAALAEIEALWEVPDDSPEAERLEVLALIVDAYEKSHFSIEAPDPISFLEYVLDTRELSLADLEPFMGSPGKVAVVMSRQAPLSLEMIRHLAAGLSLPADVLIQEYALRQEAA
jgi:HTH-type transcriptional regulator / antitoxin HigA